MVVIIKLIGLLIICYVLYYIVKAYQSVFELTHPEKYKHDLKNEIPYIYNKFDFITSDGRTLAGIEYIPKGICKGSIFVCHFLGGSKEAILMFVDSLLMNGYRIFSFDNRNHGESEQCKSIKNALIIDFTAFYIKLKSMGIEGPFGIMGFSMGATQALWAACTYDDIKAVISDSGPLLYVKKNFIYVLDRKKIRNSIQRIFSQMLFLYYVGFAKMARNMVKLLRNMKEMPVLLIHGERDNVITIDNAKLAYQLMDFKEASLWCVPYSRHLTNKFLSTNEYNERIVDFFNRNIAN